MFVVLESRSNAEQGYTKVSKLYIRKDVAVQSALAPNIRVHESKFISGDIFVELAETSTYFIQEVVTRYGREDISSRNVKLKCKKPSVPEKIMLDVDFVTTSGVPYVKVTRFTTMGQDPLDLPYAETTYGEFNNCAILDAYINQMLQDYFPITFGGTAKALMTNPEKRSTPIKTLNYYVEEFKNVIDRKPTPIANYMPGSNGTSDAIITEVERIGINELRVWCGGTVVWIRDINDPFLFEMFHCVFTKEKALKNAISSVIDLVHYTIELSMRQYCKDHHMTYLALMVFNPSQIKLITSGGHRIVPEDTPINSLTRDDCIGIAVKSKLPGYMKNYFLTESRFS